MTPRWIGKLLTEVQRKAENGHVRLTYKAERELAALGFGLDFEDACDILKSLTSSDFFHRLRSQHTGEWLYVFKPMVAGTVLYLKLHLRNECVVISLHEDEVEHGGD